MKLFIIAAVLAVAAAAPSGYQNKADYRTTPSTYSPYSSGYNKPSITITDQSDVRNLDGSSHWSYAGSDYTTREESQVQKKLASRVVYAQDSYGKGYATDRYEDAYGNTNKGSSYWISPEGQKFTLTWIADKNGFQPKGDHLPVPPVHEYVLPVAPALPYSRSGNGYY